MFKLNSLFLFYSSVYLNLKFVVAGEIKSGIPSFQLPQFSYERLVEPMIALNTTSNWTDIITNKTFEAVTFNTIVNDLGTRLAIIPMIAILEQVAIAKAFCMLIDY